MEEKQMQRSSYTLLKAMAIPLVVLGHICLMYSQYGAFQPLVGSDPLQILSTLIYSFHMPVFFMISGCVYGYGLQQGKYRAPGSFLRKKARRLLIPYFLFGFLTVVPVVYFCKLEELSVWQACVRNILLVSNPRHLWYVFVLFLIFAVAAALRPLTQKCPLVPFLLSVAVYFIAEPFIPQKIAGIANVFQLTNLLRNMIFFFFGIFLNSRFSDIRKWVCRLRFLWLLLPIAQLSYLLFAGFDVNGAQGFAWLLRKEFSCLIRVFFGLLGCVSALTLAMLLTEYLPKLACCRFVQKLADCSYGIYLLHPMLVYLLFYFLRNTAVNPYLLTAAGFIGITAVCWVLTWLWKKLTKR